MSSRHRRLAVIFGVAVLAGCASPLVAAVADLSANGFLLQDDATVKASPDRVFAGLVAVGSWWDPAHTYSHDSRNLTLEASPGGCFCEKLSAGGVRHMVVVFASAPSTLRLSGALGPLQASGIAGSLTWTLSEAGSGTRVDLSYSVGGYMRGGFEKIAPVVDSVLRAQLARLKAFVETGKPDAAVP